VAKLEKPSVKPPAKKLSVKAAAKASESTREREDAIRHLAYLKWLNATGGQTLGEDPEGTRFWLEAEQEYDAENNSPAS
jgi:hypothetical protein